MRHLKPYNESIEHQMLTFYIQLEEKAKRHYAAIEAQKIGYGGKAYIIRLLGIHHKTLNRGIKELNTPELYATLPIDKQRMSGGGRKKK